MKVKSASLATSVSALTVGASNTTTGNSTVATNMDNGSNATLNVYPSLEAIAEFKVLTSNYGAQYGRNGSGTGGS